MGSIEQIALRLGFTILLVGCATNSSQPPATWDGLEYRPGKGTGALYVRPGDEFKAYRTVMIDPLVVAIDKDWHPVLSTIPVGQGVAPDHMSSSEIQHVKDTIAGEFRNIFVKEVTAGGYQVVEQPGGDTVRVSPGIADVHMESKHGGAMTLVLELRDAPSGQLLARLVDRKTGDMGFLQFPDSVTDNVNFRRAVQAWARRLRAGLDEMSGQSP